MAYLWDKLKQILAGAGGAGLVQAPGIPKPTPAQIATAANPLKAGFTGRGGLGGEELEQTDVDLFVAGELALILDSSWLSYAKYHPAAQELEVGIMHAVHCRGLVASSMTAEHARSFAQSPSKGSWWWQHVFVAGEGAGRGWDRKTHVPVRWL